MTFRPITTYGERDFGAFDHAGERIFWKIDYYDRTLRHGSEDPSDPTQTVRLLTIMFASEVLAVLIWTNPSREIEVALFVAALGLP